MAIKMMKMSNKLIIKNDLFEVQTLPDNKLIFLISDDNDDRYLLSDFKKQISSLIYDIKEEIYDIKEERKRIENRLKKELAVIAHTAEVEHKTGLGDVVNQFYGDFCLKQSPALILQSKKLPINFSKFQQAKYEIRHSKSKIKKSKIKNNFLARILARLSTLQRKLRYINELSFFNRWIEKFKTEQINDFHFNFKNKHINEKMYRKSKEYIKGCADIETKLFSFEELIKEMKKYKIPYHKYFIINELWNNLKINELKDYIDIFNSKYGHEFQPALKNDIFKIKTLTISDKLSPLIKNFMEINKIKSPFLFDYVKFLEWLFSDIDFSDNRDYGEKLTDYTHFVWDLMSNAKKI